ncbi:MAG: sulfite exporter TauE/SafE family protein [Endomicrobiales bacterium]|nr:sulfite exporter TauE/SafE family protein [Endomicrobiales bacterium]
MAFISGILLGLSNNLTCAGVCAPVLLPYLVSEQKGSAKATGLFLLGRLAAYAAFGVLSGAAGIYFEARLNPRIFGVFLAVFALWLMLYSTGKAGVNLSLCRVFASTASAGTLPFYAGFIMGMNLCPPFLLALALALDYGSVMGALALFMGFYAGSSAWMIPLFFADRVKMHPVIVKSLRVFLFLVGSYFLWRGITVFISPSSRL